MTTSPTDETLPAVGVVPLLTPLGDVDAAVCVDGVCAVPVMTDETPGADE